MAKAPTKEGGGKPPFNSNSKWWIRTLGKKQLLVEGYIMAKKKKVKRARILMPTTKDGKEFPYTADGILAAKRHEEFLAENQ